MCSRMCWRFHAGTAQAQLHSRTQSSRHPLSIRHMSELGCALDGQLDIDRETGVRQRAQRGPYHNGKHLSELQALLAFFIFRGLETMVVGRTAPRRSWANEAERVMSVLNRGRQGCALCSTLMGARFERVMNTCGGMNATRKAAEGSQRTAAERAKPAAAEEAQQNATAAG